MISKRYENTKKLLVMIKVGKEKLNNVAKQIIILVQFGIIDMVFV